MDAEGAAAVAGSLPDAVALIAATNDEAQVRAALDTFGATPDMLVNNAGIVRFGPLLDMSLDDWRAVVDVILGTHRVNAGTCKHLKSVNITSDQGV